MEIVRRTAENSNGFTLPGWEPARLAELEHVLELYKSVDEEKLFENFKYFLGSIIPTCEEVGVKMACHPDDPGWPIFGLPRITHDQAGFDRMVNAARQPLQHASCLCTGSLGSNVQNDIRRWFAISGRDEPQNRLPACVRNIKHLGSDPASARAATCPSEAIWIWTDHEGRGMRPARTCHPPGSRPLR